MKQLQAWTAICSALLLLLVACGQNPQDATPPTVPGELAGLIAIEVAGIGSDDISSRAYGDPEQQTSSLSTQAIEEEKGIRPRDLTLLSLDTFTVGERGDGGIRYLSATFEVTNNTNKTFKNLTLMGVGTQNSQAGTPLRNVRLRNNRRAPDRVVQAMKPIHGMRFDATARAPIVQNDMANFQAFGENELPAKPFVRSNIQQYFPYGFVVEDSDPNGGDRGLAPGEKGIVTFSYALPLQEKAVDDPFDFTVTFQAVDDDSSRVTESEKEQGKDSAETRARNLGGAELVLLGNSETKPSSNLSVKRICVLRTAGTAENPLAFLVNNTEGECVGAGEDPEEPGGNPGDENPDGTRLFVDADADTGGDGESWATAFRHLQDALDKGRTEGIFETWIADGEYRADASERGVVQVGDRKATYNPADGSRLLGGFAGGETKPEDRDPAKNTAVLTGIVTDAAGNIHIVSISAGTKVEIDGVTVTGGFISSRDDAEGGAGILNEGELLLTNSVVKDNRANGSSRGGGIFNEEGGVLRLFKTKVTDNISENLGGGIADRGISLTLTDSEVSNNKALTNTGGGLVQISDSTVKIVRSTFKENESFLQGGGIFNNGGAFEMVDSFVLNNKCTGCTGGGLILKNSDFEGIKITNTTISGNEAGGFSGGIKIEKANGKVAADIVAVITNSIISDNRAAGNGGGLESSPGVRIVNSTITGNSASDDGGGLLIAGKLIMVDSTVSNNSAGRNGGGIFAAGEGDTAILRTTVTGNTAENGGGISFESVFESETFRLVQSTLSDNVASGKGGGLFTKVSIEDDNLARAKVHNSLIINNRANEGGGVYHDLGRAEARNVTIAGNVAQTGGGVFAKKTRLYKGLCKWSNLQRRRS